MNSNLNLVTSYNFRGRDYLVTLCPDKSSAGNIEIKVTEKRTLEEWQGSYDSSYIENLTKKTGNFKRFDTFISMLKSGLLGTSQCVTLDLLTYEDLEMLRNRTSRNFGMSHPSHVMAPQPSNRRYLIVTYTVEFDRIHYPLAMEYSGLPDPRILQETIQRLEKQVSDLQSQLSNNSTWEDVASQIDILQKKVADVTTENIILKEKIKKLNTVQVSKYCNQEMEILTQSLSLLEKKFRNKSDDVVKLKKENCLLSIKLEEALKNERMMKSQWNPTNIDPYSTNTVQKKKFHSPSPNRNRSFENCADKPFSRISLYDRKTHSARSSVVRSSSDDSVIGLQNGRKLKHEYQFRQVPRARALSPSFSELSHNTEISRCACKGCLNSKFNTGGDKKQTKPPSKATLLKRIQSLEKLISGIVLN